MMYSMYSYDETEEGGVEMIATTQNTELRGGGSDKSRTWSQMKMNQKRNLSYRSRTM